MGGIIMDNQVMPIPHLYLPQEFIYGDTRKMPQHTPILGLGVAYMKSNSDGSKHVESVDVNIKAVKKSFEPFIQNFRNTLFQSINSFYQSDSNKYKNIKGEKNFNKGISLGSLTFNVDVQPSRLSKTTFTYIYTFKLAFNDQDFKIEASNNIQNLQSVLSTFRTALVDKFNYFIGSEGVKRRESELNLQETIRLCEALEISEVQKNAPVLSSQNCQFNLSQVKFDSLVKDVLFRRAQRKGVDPRDKTYDPVLFERYCRGESDCQIATDDYIQRLKYNPNVHQKLDMYGQSAGLYGYVTPVGLINDLKTIIKGSDLIDTKSMHESIAPEGPKTMWGKILAVGEDIANRLIAAIDLGSIMLMEQGNPVISAVGTAWQAAHGLVQTLEEERRNTGYQALAEVPILDMIHYKLTGTDRSITKEIIVEQSNGKQKVMSFSPISEPSFSSEFKDSPKKREWKGVQKYKS